MIPRRNLHLFRNSVNPQVQQEGAIKKPHLSFKKWGSKSPYHIFPPSKGIGERISEGMIAEWEKLSIQKDLGLGGLFWGYP